MAFSRLQWVKDVLASDPINNTRPTTPVVMFMLLWTYAETGAGQAPNGGARFNLLNTTQPEPGDSWFNSFGSQGQYHVRNYPTYTEGVQTNAQQIGNGYYPNLLKALQTNDVGALGAGTGVPSGAIQRELGTWGTGAGWVHNVPGGGNDQTFNYGNATPVKAGSGVGSDVSTTTTTTPDTSKPCPTGIANVPFFGGIFCAGWNTGNFITNGQGAGNCAPWDVGCIIKAATPGLKKIGVFLIGALLVYIGIRLLFPGISGGIGSEAINKLTEAFSESNEEAPSEAPSETPKPSGESAKPKPPPTAPPAPKSPSPDAQKKQEKKDKQKQALETAVKVAAVA